ncbi:MAG: pyridoxine 5'-phosphate synthase [Ignavibacteria bacterium RIFOXYB2_FULL_35_12]|nr:MAG: pyridoxine 5'-phosphate synthase [Ignavibacteria bacterium GWF2_35_20]OGU83014.1 MAG: pyridoxine 5'-phosphate synthase [Ignavibacteria bacterium RIFOXYA2_FULL_35_9]OGU88104.1 MAG: pyridoxine 5'-phosphate synthase [Ignavibacteria bacterium RIFOXYC12_FULL_35_11]OGU91213.1 MAG: pyridoxine 5'-phosphate synthase [Ignavibacteria bacterium RIFOXYA12_FULL_35_25]OGU94225.1 MAG: pyridoxine 5'-phosphate synthase [Ignavibacteria bacterium RIFOXYB12_FULL_35_14]OGV00367.1 MAG: pyridoxine 5'-phosphat
MRFALNIDHIATLRNARGETQPDPVTAALLAEQAGVDGIVVHLREDRRHINERDVRLLRELITTKLDLEMAATEEIIKIACDVGPELATIVPEKRQELTTEGGISVIDNVARLKETVSTLHKFEIEVSMFIEPDINQIDASAEIDADYIEIHTGVFANALTEEEQFDELDRIRTAAKHAKKLGLGVNAGHGLNYSNIKIFRELTDIDEVSIGHAILARAVFVGLKEAVREMIGLLRV